MYEKLTVSQDEPLLVPNLIGLDQFIISFLEASHSNKESHLLGQFSFFLNLRQACDLLINPPTYFHPYYNEFKVNLTIISYQDIIALESPTFAI